jgi:2-polyprenyl-3-methyl-5-hydroxy-6-metoxy-1,4-benzoquinol methylase
MIDELERWKYLLTSGPALDIGAGDGETSLWLVRHGFAVDALEIDPRRTQKLAARIGDLPIRLHTSNVLDFPFPIEYYTLIVAGAVLHFIPSAKLERTADAMIAALQPNGMLLAATLTEDDPSYGQTGAEGSAVVKHYFGANELHQLFGALELLEYDESRRAAPDSILGYRSGATIVARKTARSI